MAETMEEIFRKHVLLLIILIHGVSRWEMHLPQYFTKFYK